MRAQHFTWMYISFGEVLMFGFLGHFSVTTGATSDVVRETIKDKHSNTNLSAVSEIETEWMSKLFYRYLILNFSKTTTTKENNVKYSVEKIRTYLIQRVLEKLELETKGTHILDLDLEALQPYFKNQNGTFEQMKKELQAMLKYNMENCNILSRQNFTNWITAFLLNSTILPKTPKLNMDKNTNVKSCFSENSRDSGTDLPHSIITKTKTMDAKSCQKGCQNVEGCNFFLYFTTSHSQWFKRRECRLLRQSGTIQTNNKGHTSGPKFCHSTSSENNNDSMNSLESKLKSEEFINLTFRNLTKSYNELISRLCLRKFDVLAVNTGGSKISAGVDEEDFGSTPPSFSTSFCNSGDTQLLPGVENEIIDNYVTSYIERILHGIFLLSLEEGTSEYSHSGIEKLLVEILSTDENITEEKRVLTGIFQSWRYDYCEHLQQNEERTAESINGITESTTSLKSETDIVTLLPSQSTTFEGKDEWTKVEITSTSSPIIVETSFSSESTTSALSSPTITKVAITSSTSNPSKPEIRPSLKTSNMLNSAPPPSTNLNSLITKTASLISTENHGIKTSSTMPTSKENNRDLNNVAKTTSVSPILTRVHDIETSTTIPLSKGHTDELNVFRATTVSKISPDFEDEIVTKTQTEKAYFKGTKAIDANDATLNVFETTAEHVVNCNSNSGKQCVSNQILNSANILALASNVQMTKKKRIPEFTTSSPLTDQTTTSHLSSDGTTSSIFATNVNMLTKKTKEMPLENVGREINANLQVDKNNNLLNNFNGSSKECLNKDARYSGTDMANSVLKKLKTNNVSICQNACLKQSDCNFFLYFTKKHAIWFKRKECRLLRFAGELQKNMVGHISGPKICLPFASTNGNQIRKTLEETNKISIDKNNIDNISNVKRQDTDDDDDDDIKQGELGTFEDSPDTDQKTESKIGAIGDEKEATVKPNISKDKLSSESTNMNAAKDGVGSITSSPKKNIENEIDAVKVEHFISGSDVNKSSEEHYGDNVLETDARIDAISVNNDALENTNYIFYNEDNLDEEADDVEDEDDAEDDVEGEAEIVNEYENTNSEIDVPLTDDNTKVHSTTEFLQDRLQANAVSTEAGKIVSPIDVDVEKKQIKSIFVRYLPTSNNEIDHSLLYVKIESSTPLSSSVDLSTLNDSGIVKIRVNEGVSQSLESISPEAEPEIEYELDNELQFDDEAKVEPETNLKRNASLHEDNESKNRIVKPSSDESKPELEVESGSDSYDEHQSSGTSKIDDFSMTAPNSTSKLDSTVSPTFDSMPQIDNDIEKLTGAEDKSSSTTVDPLFEYLSNPYFSLYPKVKLEVESNLNNDTMVENVMYEVLSPHSELELGNDLTKSTSSVGDLDSGTGADLSLNFTGNNNNNLHQTAGNFRNTSDGWSIHKPEHSNQFQLEDENTLAIGDDLSGLLRKNSTTNSTRNTSERKKLTVNVEHHQTEEEMELGEETMIDGSNKTITTARIVTNANTIRKELLSNDVSNLSTNHEDITTARTIPKKSSEHTTSENSSNYNLQNTTEVQDEPYTNNNHIQSDLDDVSKKSLAGSSKTSRKDTTENTFANTITVVVQNATILEYSTTIKSRFTQSQNNETRSSNVRTEEEKSEIDINSRLEIEDNIHHAKAVSEKTTKAEKGINTSVVIDEPDFETQEMEHMDENINNKKAQLLNNKDEEYTNKLGEYVEDAAPKEELKVQEQESTKNPNNDDFTHGEAVTVKHKNTYQISSIKHNNKQQSKTHKNTTSVLQNNTYIMHKIHEISTNRIVEGTKEWADNEHHFAAKDMETKNETNYEQQNNKTYSQFSMSEIFSGLKTSKQENIKNKNQENKKILHSKQDTSTKRTEATQNDTNSFDNIMVTTKIKEGDIIERPTDVSPTGGGGMEAYSKKYLGSKNLKNFDDYITNGEADFVIENLPDYTYTYDDDNDIDETSTDNYVNTPVAALDPMKSTSMIGPMGDDGKMQSMEQNLSALPMITKEDVPTMASPDSLTSTSSNNPIGNEATATNVPNEIVASNRVESTGNDVMAHDIVGNFTTSLTETTEISFISSNTTSDDKRNAASFVPIDNTTTGSKAVGSTSEMTTNKPNGRKQSERKKRPLWMSLWTRPFSKKRPRTSKSRKIIFPDNSSLTKDIKQPYHYIYPNYRKRTLTPFERAFWLQFYVNNE